MSPWTALLLVAAAAGGSACDDAGARLRGLFGPTDERPASPSAEAEHVRAKDTPSPSVEDLEEAADAVRREREDIAEAAARERAEYRKTLRSEIVSIDRRVDELKQELARLTGDAKGGKARAIASAREWKRLLMADLEDIESVDEDGWPEVKARIDHDLEDERPSSVPRWFDKSITI